MLLRPITFVYLVGIAAACFSCATPSIVATQAIQLGDEMNNINRYEESIRHYEEYLKLAPTLGVYRNPFREAEVCRKLSHAYATQGKYKQSTAYLKRAIAIDSASHSSDVDLVEDYRLLGAVQAYTGNYTAALKILQQAIQLSEGMEKSVKGYKVTQAAITYLSLAQINLSIGNYKESEVQALKALDYFQRTDGQDQGAADAKLVLGIVNRDKANYEQAIVLFEQSTVLARKSGLNTARQLQALSEVHLLQGDIEKAIKLRISSLEESEKTNIKPQIIIALIRLGDAYEQLGDKDQSSTYYQKALILQKQIEGDTLSLAPGSRNKIEQEGGSLIGSALICLRMGDSFYKQNKLDSAYLLFQRSEGYFKKMESKEGLAKSKLEMAKVLIAQGNDVKIPILLLSEAAKLTRQIDLLWQIHYRKGMAFELGDKYDSAKFYYKKAIHIVESIRGNLTVEEFKTAFANSKVELYDRMILLLMKKQASINANPADILESFYYSEQSRSRTFLDMLGNQKINPKINADTSLLEKEQLLRLKIQQLTRQMNSLTSRVEENLDHQLQMTQEEHRAALEKIKLNNPAYASITSIEPPSLEQIQSNLGNNEALLEYWVSDEALVIWVITSKTISSKLIKCSKTYLNQQITACRNSITVRSDELSQKPLRNLYQTIIFPVKAELKGITNLVIAPHKSLHFLPFHALLNEVNQYMVDQFMISYVPSASVFYYCNSKKKQEGNRFLGLALGDWRIGEYPGLPGTEDEVIQVSKLYADHSHFVKGEFTESSLKDKADQFNFIHIATHGVFNPLQPLYSYLLTSASDRDDGRLTVNEIFGMNITSKLVTLSACDTGLGELGDGDDLVGLSRAFIYAGSSAVVVSLWKVDDATTAWLMTRFHEYLNLQKGTVEALTLAQRDLLKKKGSTASPYYWAPFVLIGNTAH